jgi:hypothetical protein
MESSTHMVTRFIRTSAEGYGPRVARRRSTAAERLAAARASRPDRPTAKVYYFHRPDGAIKIGTSEHLADRLRNLRAQHGGELLATEPGGYNAENARHRQFSGYALGGEWFTASTELEQLIASLCGGR